MGYALKPHPATPCAAITAIGVEVMIPHAGAIVLRYVATGDIGLLRLPPPAAPTRTDELWKTTCFEAFVKPGEGAGYYEVNVAPSTQWAAYSFTAYREGMAPAEIATPYTNVQVHGDRFEMLVSLDLSTLPMKQAWWLGLSAVIEETNGTKSYWALAHPPGKPDFHHADCFALELPAAERA